MPYSNTAKYTIPSNGPSSENRKKIAVVIIGKVIVDNIP